MRQYAIRTGKVLFGMFLYGLGPYLIIQANTGLSPWAAFNVGLSLTLGISYGVASASTGIFFLIIVLLLKEKVGIGTIFDAVLIGVFVDFFQWLNFIPVIQNTALGIAVLLLAQVSISVATYFYISPGLGAGPRDTLMVVLGKRFPGAPIGFVRGCLEGTALLIGWLLDAKVGIGTVISVFGISFILQYTLKFFRFDIRSVVHENLGTSLKNMAAHIRGRAPIPVPDVYGCEEDAPEKAEVGAADSESNAPPA